MGPPGRHYGGLQTRPQGVRAGRPPLGGDELRALRRLQREQEPKSPFVFTSERGAPFTTAGFARMVERAGPKPSLGSRPTRTCCSTHAATRWPIGATTPGRCRHTSAIATFSTRCATLKCHRRGSRIFGELARRSHPRASMTRRAERQHEEEREGAHTTLPKAN
jgi:hypothetical protein